MLTGDFISLVQLGPIINGGGDEVIELAQTNLRR